MNPNLLYLLGIVLLCSCAKADIKKNGCTGSGYSFTPETGCPIFLHNLFTPNGDGYNDIFPLWADCAAVSSLQMKIKKGNKVIYESSNKENYSWDGTMKNGNEAKEGVYDYEFSFVNDGANYHVDGSITLIRDISKPIVINNLGDCSYNYQDPIQLEHP